MRLHISLADDLVRDLDERVGPRRRSAFIGEAVRRALEDERRWELVEASFGAIEDAGHEWDADPAAWVREQRYADERRVG
jgi:metal-responsive CopG/Arc/MetJ family transcriptional regulator